MKYLLFILMLMFLPRSDLLTMEKYSPHFMNRGLLILLDSSEYKANRGGTITQQLCVALMQKAGPIIASSSLVANALKKWKFKPITQKDEDNLHTKRPLSNYDKMLIWNNLKERKTDEFLLLAQALNAALFEPTEWIVKKINREICLLIPTAYLAKLNILAEEINITSQHMSDVELRLGLKVNHMQTILFQNIIDSEKNTHVPESSKVDPFMQALWNSTTDSSAIFCTRKDYYDRNKDIPLWSFYLNGHGNFTTSIAHLTIQDFKEFLNFLENKINTHVLIYESCYAAGINTEMVYKNYDQYQLTPVTLFSKSKHKELQSHKKTQQTLQGALQAIYKSTKMIQNNYSFALITKALVDMPTSDVVLSFDLDTKDENNYLLSLRTLRRFDKFLELVTEPFLSDYTTVTQTLFPLLPRFMKEKGGTNVPQIKLPGTNWFSVMASKKEVVSINPLFIKANPQRTSLDVITFFKTDPLLILLYADNIPFELIINSTKLKFILSMIPGRSLTTIKKISSSTATLPEIVEWLIGKSSNFVSRKICYIKEIVDRTSIHVSDVIAYTLKHRLVKEKKEEHSCFAFFTHEDVCYIKEPSQMCRKATVEEEITYKKLLSTVNNKPYHFQTTITLPDKDDIAIDELPDIRHSSCIIDALISPHVYFETLVTKLREIRTQNTVIWIKKLTVPYQAVEPFTQNNLDEKTHIILTDVIISDGPDAFFTYNDKFYQGSTHINHDYKKEIEAIMHTPLQSLQRTAALLPLTATTEEIEKINKNLLQRSKKDSNSVTTLIQVLTQLKNKVSNLLQTLYSLR